MLKGLAGRARATPGASVLAMVFAMAVAAVGAAAASAMALPVTPSPGERSLEPRQMQSDVHFLTATLLQAHPALADERARNAFIARAGALEAKLSEPLPAWQFFSKANALAASLGDAHTTFWLPDEAGTLPIEFTWASDGVVLTRVLDPDLAVRPGDEIMSLGGRTPEQLLADLQGWIPHNNPYWLRAQAGRYLANGYVLRGLGLQSADSVAVVVRRPGARLIEAAVPVWSGLTVFSLASLQDDASGRTASPAQEAGLRPGDRIVAVGDQPVDSSDGFAAALQAQAQRAHEGGESAVTLRIVRRGEPLTLKLRPMAVQEAGSPGGQPGIVYKAGVVFGASSPGERSWFGWTVNRAAGYGLFWLDRCSDTTEYRQAVDAFFAAVRNAGVRRVAIDLRRNGGGNSMVVAAFLKYIPHGTLRAGSGWTRPSPQLKQQRSVWERLFMQVGHAVFGGRWFPWPIQPRAPRSELFSGQVLVLTGWGTFSSAADFAAMLSDNRLATVVGAPTGANPTEYGDTLSFNLPGAGWAFSVSSTRFVRPDPARNSQDAVYPDLPVPTMVRDLQAGRDPVVAWLEAGQ